MCPCVAEYFLKCLPKLHPRRHYCLFLPVSSAEGGAVLIHQCSRTRAPRFLACFAGRPLAIRTRKTLLFTRAIRNTIECTLRGHSIVMNRAFGVACFSFFISLADSRSALPCLLRRPSARYPARKKNKCRLRRRLFFFRAGYIIPQVAINFNKTPCTIP